MSALSLPIKGIVTTALGMSLALLFCTTFTPAALGAWVGLTCIVLFTNFYNFRPLERQADQTTGEPSNG